MLLTPQQIFDAEAVPHAELLLKPGRIDGQRWVGHGGHRNGHGKISGIRQCTGSLLSSVLESDVAVVVEVRVEMWMDWRRYCKNEAKQLGGH